MNDATPPPPPAMPPVPAKGGSGSKWVLFGCGGCLGLVALGVVFIAVIFFFVFGALKNTDVYQTALKRAQSSSEVQAALGTPVEAGFMMSGSVSVNNGQGTADITIPISGPKGNADVVAKATSQPGQTWQYTVLEVHVTGSDQVIDLRGAP